jgi:hypothetical protein
MAKTMSGRLSVTDSLKDSNPPNAMTGTPLASGAGLTAYISGINILIGILWLCTGNISMTTRFMSQHRKLGMFMMQSLFLEGSRRMPPFLNL